MEHFFDFDHPTAKTGVILTGLFAFVTLTDIDIVVRISAGLIACVVGVLTAIYYYIKIKKERNETK